MAKVAKDIDEYISGTPGEVQATLRAPLGHQDHRSDRERVHLLPNPVLRLQGPLVRFGLQSKHIGVFEATHILQQHKAELAGYSHVVSPPPSPGKRVPVSLIRKLVRDAAKRNEALVLEGK